MKKVLNVPSNLPAHIVEQYIGTVQAQLALMSKLVGAKPLENNNVSIKRGSAKNMITFIADDFSAAIE